jgi:hypothetical protein
MLPRWFTVAMTGALVFMAAAGLGGVALLLIHAYQPLAVILVAAVAATFSAFAVARTVEASPAAAHGATLAAIGLALVFLAITGVFHSEHLLVDRDPGAYVNSGRAIAGQHSLPSVTRVGPFKDRKFFVSSPAFNESSGEQTWFLPMLPVLLALGWSIGGFTGLLMVPPLLGTLGLLACYALAARVVGPRWAVLVPALLLVNPLQSWFARDAYSELVVQVVVLGGIWLYLQVRSAAAPRVAAIAGALIATSVLARFDALAIVAALTVFVALEWTRCDEEESPTRRRRAIAVFGLVMLGATLYCSVLAYVSSRAYLHWHRGSTRPLYALLLAAVAFAAIWMLGHRIRPGTGARAASALATVWLSCGLAIAVCLWAYFLRPGRASQAFSLNRIDAIVPNRHEWVRAQSHWSARWFVSWFGASAVVLAVGGLLVLFRRALRRDAAATVLVLVVVPIAVLYLWRPSVAPDQPWAMRRFLPVVIPGVAIAAVVALHRLWFAARRLRNLAPRTFAYVAIIALAFATLAPSGVATAQLLQARAQHGAATEVRRLCDALPRNASVLVFPASYLDYQMTQTIRGFCLVPTATAPTEPNLDLVSLADDWRREGRQLYVVTASPGQIGNPTHAGLATVGRFEIDDRYEPKLTYRARPRKYASQPRKFALLRVVPAP